MSDKIEFNTLLQRNVLTASEVAKGKPVNQRTTQEIFEARNRIKEGLPPIYELTWEEWLPFGMEVQKQSCHSQPDSAYVQAARFEYDWAVANLRSY